MNATLAAQTASFELQEFNETARAWVTVEVLTQTPAMAQNTWRTASRFADCHVRLLLVGAPADANVCFGSASPDPVQDAQDAQDAVREPVGSYWSVDGRI